MTRDDVQEVSRDQMIQDLVDYGEVQILVTFLSKARYVDSKLSEMPEMVSRDGI